MTPRAMGGRDAVTPAPRRGDLRAVLMVLLLLVALGVPSIAQAQTERVEYYGHDTVGSVRVVFDPAGTILGRMDYGPFGDELSALTGMPKERFAGMPRDGETGQDYAQARNYLWRVGRFNAPDPVYSSTFDPQRWNRYSYALNDPIRLGDPTGQCVPGDCRPENSLDFLAFYFSFGAYPPTYGEMPNLVANQQRGDRSRRGQKPTDQEPPDPGKPEPGKPKRGKPDDPIDPRNPQNPKLPPRPPKQPRPEGGYPSCRSFRIVGDVGEISVQSAFPGNVQWGVTLDRPVIGVLFAFEQYTRADGRREANISNPGFFNGTGGTIHGSQRGLKSGSEYHLQAVAIITPYRAYGALGCIVP